MIRLNTAIRTTEVEIPAFIHGGSVRPETDAVLMCREWGVRLRIPVVIPAMPDNKGVVFLPSRMIRYASSRIRESL